MDRDDRTPGFDQLRDELAHAAERDVARRRTSRGPMRWLRRLGIPAGVLGITLGGAVAGQALFSTTGDPIEPDSEALPTAGNPIDPGVVVSSITPDPELTHPAWVLKVYAGEDGLECVDLGRLRRGRFGSFLEGRFRPSDVLDGTCTDATKDPFFFAGQQYGPERRTVIYGLARERNPVTVRVDGQARTVRPGSFGTFIVVVEGVIPMFEGISATTTVAGRRVTKRAGG